MIEVFQNYSDKLITALLEHIEITALSISIAFLLAAIITIFLLFHQDLRQLSVYILSLLYAIPSFALFALLIPITGLGKTTAIIVLVLYAQYTMVRTFL
ncbi:hypothetical protein Si141_01789 [Streptococcus infantarius subsp. infantarius]|nr:hypothetical protein [Streptococcus infantarius subsp. infantarius]